MYLQCKEAEMQECPLHLSEYQYNRCLLQHKEVKHVTAAILVYSDVLAPVRKQPNQQQQHGRGHFGQHQLVKQAAAA
jgi:hypothetical protein